MAPWPPSGVWSLGQHGPLALSSEYATGLSVYVSVCPCPSQSRIWAKTAAYKRISVHFEVTCTNVLRTRKVAPSGE